MKRMIPVLSALAAVLLLATIAAAQGNGRLDGQVLDRNGNPYPDVTVQIKNPDTGQSYTTKTDKKGHYIQLGLLTGIYDVTFSNAKDQMNYATKTRVDETQENTLNINLKEILAKSGPSPEELKKKEEAENKFNMMKQHFDAGIAALNDSATLRQQLKTAGADQGGIKDKLTTDYQTAITEFQQAEQGAAANPKDVKNHALIWGNLGQAYEFAGKYDDAANAFQKAIDLQPQPPFYEHMATSLAGAAVASTDPKDADAKIAAASAACDKSAALPAATPGPPNDRCYKNLGIILTNKGRMKDAVAPLQKATQVDPKDPDAWFLLGGALSGTIDTKTEGDKMVYIVPPGTADAYKKYLELAPAGPHAADSKAMLDALAQYSQGEDLSVSKRKKH
jgi:tetratricopeptide (TPR) repeat protein